MKRSHQDAEDEEDLTLPRHNSTSYKRIRTMPPDSPDSQTMQPLSQNDSQHVNHTQTAWAQHESQHLDDSQHTENYSLADSQRTNSYPLSQSEETSIEFLQGAFPSLPREVSPVFCPCWSLQRWRLSDSMAPFQGWR